MIVVCAVCAKQERPAFVQEKEPYGDTSVTHGYCPVHHAAAMAEARRVAKETQGAGGVRARGGGVMIVREKLEQAAQLIDEASLELNLTRTVCEHCGVARYEAFPEYQLGQELTAMVRKLRRAAGGG